MAVDFSIFSYIQIPVSCCGIVIWRSFFFSFLCSFWTDVCPFLLWYSCKVHFFGKQQFLELTLLARPAGWLSFLLCPDAHSVHCSIDSESAGLVLMSIVSCLQKGIAWASFPSGRKETITDICLSVWAWSLWSMKNTNKRASSLTSRAQDLRWKIPNTIANS